MTTNRYKPGDHRARKARPATNSGPVLYMTFHNAVAYFFAIDALEAKGHPHAATNAYSHAVKAGVIFS